MTKEECEIETSKAIMEMRSRIAELKAGRPQWHDLRKNPDDLPKKKEGEYWSNIGLVVFEYTDSKHSWFTPLCEACDDQEDVSDEVIAWCELPKFEE